MRETDKNYPNDPYDTIDALRAELANVTGERDSLSEVASSFHAQLVEANDTLAGVQATFSDYELRARLLRGEIAKRDATIDALRAELATVTAEWNNALAERNDLRDELAAAQEAIAEYKRLVKAADAEAERKLRMWQATGDAIMQTAFGKSAPLSDSDVCGLIVALRAERDAWRNDAEAKGDALEASRDECNQWARKVAAMETERDKLREQLREAAFMPRR